jgi:hypothetical protein
VQISAEKKTFVRQGWCVAPGKELADTMTQISNLSMIALFALLAESAALLSIVT